MGAAATSGVVPDRSKSVGLLLNIFFGFVGADRYYQGQTKQGIALSVMTGVSVVLMIVVAALEIDLIADFLKALGNSAKPAGKSTEDTTFDDLRARIMQIWSKMERDSAAKAWAILILFLLAVLVSAVVAVWGLVNFFQLVISIFHPASGQGYLANAPSTTADYWVVSLFAIVPAAIWLVLFILELAGVFATAV